MGPTRATGAHGLPRIVVTLGDPRGIGPEVVLVALESFQRERPFTPVRVVGPEGDLTLDELTRLSNTAREGGLDDMHAGRVAALSLERAASLAIAGEAHAVVTAPVHKPSMRAAGWGHPGQTEMLGALAGARSVGMLMAAETTRVGPPLRVLLATTHIALRDVPSRVTRELLRVQIGLLDAALRRDWGLASPRIALCGLNPHASDGGLFGGEEAALFAPAVWAARAAGVDVTGPISADTVFVRALDGVYDAVVAPYHDVGMAAFKTVAFGTGVNVTLGLPFVRTSPDHGTAFDIAGTGTADPGSMLEALRMAERLALKRFDMDSAGV